VIVLGWSDTTAKVTSVTDHSGNTYTLAVGPEESAPYVMQMVAFKVAGANLCAGVRPVNPRFSQQV
jgi:hypothetical protein